MGGFIIRFTLGAILTCSVLAASASADKWNPVNIETEAYAGAPFGVARVTVSVGERTYWWQRNRQLSQEMLNTIESPDNPQRTLYQAYQVHTPTAGMNDRDVTRWTVYFLFKGDKDFEVQMQTEDFRRAMGEWVKIKPVKDDKGHARLLRQWWGAYCDDARQVNRAGLYRPTVENYLVHMLARRLKLKPSRLQYNEFVPSGGDVGSVISQMTGAESVRLAMQAETMLKSSDDSLAKADQPLPEAVLPQPVEIPEITEKPDIEPIASHVPVECFYVRFGNFKNFLWGRDFIEKHGGDVRALLTSRGIDYGINTKLEGQLALSITPLSRMMGQMAISDVALVGTDTFIREGASIGMIIEAKNNAALSEMLRGQRKLVRIGNKDAREETIKIAGHDVSWLHTPDNRIRSFYVADGKYHFVTTSRSLVGRFLEAGQGKNNLADVPEFRWGRTKVPLGNDYTITAYLSDAFFRQIIGPKYRIEMTRRSQAVAELELAQMAVLAAANEGTPTRDVKRLIELGFLPAHFGRRPDGSHVIIEKDRIVDSLRGAYGCFTPVVDLPIEKATQAEVAGYREFSRFYQGLWQNMDPVSVGLRREVDSKKKTQRLLTDIYITPYVRSHYGLLAGNFFPADKRRCQPIKEAVVTAEINVARYKYVGGLMDFGWPVFIRKGQLCGFHYHDGWSVIKPFLGMLPVDGGELKRLHLPFFGTIENEGKDKDGYYRSREWSDLFQPEIWVRETKKWALMTPERDDLDAIGAQLKLEPSPNQAKVRLSFSDPKAAPHTFRMLRMAHFVQSRRISTGNVLMLHKIMQQLGITSDKALDTAELILHGEPDCPLGGKYVSKEIRTYDRAYAGLHSRNKKPGSFVSNAWSAYPRKLEDINRVPSKYTSPLLQSFSNALIEVDVDPDTLSVHIDLEIADK